MVIVGEVVDGAVRFVGRAVVDGPVRSQVRSYFAKPSARISTVYSLSQGLTQFPSPDTMAYGVCVYLDVYSALKVPYYIPRGSTIYDSTCSVGTNMLHLRP